MVFVVVLLCGYVKVKGEEGRGKRSKVVRHAPPKPQENDSTEYIDGAGECWCERVL